MLNTIACFERKTTATNQQNLLPSNAHHLRINTYHAFKNSMSVKDMAHLNWPTNHQSTNYLMLFVCTIAFVNRLSYHLHRNLGDFEACRCVRGDRWTAELAANENFDTDDTQLGWLGLPMDFHSWVRNI